MVMVSLWHFDYCYSKRMIKKQIVGPRVNCCFRISLTFHLAYLSNALISIRSFITDASKSTKSKILRKFKKEIGENTHKPFLLFYNISVGIIIFTILHYSLPSIIILQTSIPHLHNLFGNVILIHPNKMSERIFAK